MASTDAVVSLNGVSTGNGTTVDFTAAKRNVSVILRPSATLSAGTVGIEVSHDGTNWVRRLVMHVTLRVGNHSHDFSTGAYRYWRASVLRTIAGGTITATFMEADS